MRGIGDDAAVLRGQTEPLLLTVDGFRTLVDDPYLFGRIAAHHSLNDIYAMGARPTSAMAMATVPLMAEAMMEEELYRLLKGAVDVLNGDGVPLVGGHSAEGAELSLGLALTGAAVEPLLTKDAAQAGDRLLLTKPLGVGVLLAAHMRGLVPTRLLQAGVAHMDQSNREALATLRAHEVRAATDVTGFGLLGHLGELLRASGRGAEIRLDAVPAGRRASGFRAGWGQRAASRQRTGVGRFRATELRPAGTDGAPVGRPANRRWPARLCARSPGPPTASGRWLPRAIRPVPRSASSHQIAG